MILQTTYCTHSLYSNSKQNIQTNPKILLASQIGNKDKDNSLEDSYPDVAMPRELLAFHAATLASALFRGHP